MMNELVPQNNEHDAPLFGECVFYCKGCLAIVGDSYSVLSGESVRDYNQKTCTVTLSVANNLTWPNVPVFGLTPMGSDSWFLPLSCASCKTILGRIFKQTPSDLISLQEVYTFDLPKLNVYLLRSSNLNQSMNGTVFQNAKETERSERDERIDTTIEDLKKTQHQTLETILVMDGRLTSCERELRQTEPKGDFEEFRKRVEDTLTTHLRMIQSLATTSFSTHTPPTHLVRVNDTPSLSALSTSQISTPRVIGNNNNTQTSTENSTSIEKETLKRKSTAPDQTELGKALKNSATKLTPKKVGEN
eukprot:TRINITY_DN3594_c0_g1_i1.p1 TRINITY_DN3594_c0_g1~~TRINITY_DN3594_c0_g1_i1.p1  ORF type:complete len:303 (-),score=55.61 TRINITY_DN3594_c0_g1_i1:143-1051(-)